MYHFRHEQVVPITREEAWAFLNDPSNLQKLTPPKMKLTPAGDIPAEMSDGILVSYSVQVPFLGKQTWTSEIAEVVPGHSFVDIQRKGPYKSWRHQHVIEDDPVGIRFVDEIQYEMPFSIFGKIAHALFARRQLVDLFRFRKEKIESIWPAEKKSSS